MDVTNKKYRRNSIKIIILVLFSLIISLFLEKYYFLQKLSFDRVFIVFIIIFFIGLNIILDRKKMYNFIYRKRYRIAIVILLALVLFNYNGSSLNYWDYYIQPSYTKVEFQPFLGKARPIRSDEWVVNTPIDLSQSKLSNKFSLINNISRGTNTNIGLIVKSPSLSVSMLLNPFKIMYFFNNEFGISFWWYARLIVLFMVSFEFIMLITKKKKLSLFGTILITFAPVVQWWFATALVDIIIYGELALIILNLFFDSKKGRSRIIYSILFGIVGSLYICCYYPAWEIAFAYIYAIFFFWILIKNKDKLNFKLLLNLLLSIIVIGLLVGCVLYEAKDAIPIIMNTAYPGKRVSIGGTGWQLLFTYFSSFSYSFIDMFNPCENSQFYHLFPIPLILGAYACFKKNVFKNEKKILLRMMVVLSLLLLIWNIFELPVFISKITLLFLSTPQRSQVALGYLMILLLILIISESRNSLKLNNILSFIVSLTLTLFAAKINIDMFGIYLNQMYIAFISIFIFIISFMLLSNIKKFENYIIFLLSLLTIISGATVNPMSKGIDVMYDKPIAKFIQEEVKKNPDDKWLVISQHYLTPNYFIANGASTYNSVNIYPNLEWLKQFDTNNDDEEIYNRYAHIMIDITEDDSDFEIIQGADLLHLNIKNTDLYKTNATYIAVDKDFDEKLLDLYSYDLIYDELGFKVYKVDYNLKSLLK